MEEIEQKNKKMRHDYTQNLGKQVEDQRQKRLAKNQMTRTEKRINYENLQVSNQPLFPLGLQKLGSQ